MGAVNWGQIPIVLGQEHPYQVGCSAQFLNQLIGEAGRDCRSVFLQVLAHAQELALADLVFVALDLTVQRFPAGLFLAFLNFAHHQAPRIDLAGAFLAMGGDFEGDGAGHPGADAVGEFGVPDKTGRGFAAVCVAVAAEQGLGGRRGAVGAFALGNDAGFGVVEGAAVGKGLWHLASDLAADGGVFAGADLGLSRGDGPQAQSDQGAAQNKAKAG